MEPGALVSKIGGNAFFAYAALLALQAKLVWGIWRWKDLSAGDTSGYFATAAPWVESFHTNLVWSPLYLIYYGSLRWITPDPFTVTLVHRLILVFVVDVLVLSLFRRLLPAAIAWLLAAWWAVLPINFDTLYEVHLFAAVPTLAAALIAASVPGVGGRAATFGMLLGTTLLVRNEFLIASALWLAVCVLVDGRDALADRGAAIRTIGTYVLAVLVVGLLWALLYQRSPWTLDQMRPMIRSKHTLNVCQIYAFGYQQRHQDWQKSPWVECQDLMRRDFGVDEPGMLEALRRNPRAMLEHLAWNARLVPSGIQLQLFNRASGSVNPDYASRAVLNSRAALVLTLVVSSVLGSGAWFLARDWRRGFGDWFSERSAGWALLGCLTATAVFVMIMQRPRPSYLFNQSVTLMGLVGVALCALLGLRRSQGLDWIPLPLALVLIVALPSHYGPEYREEFGRRGPVLRQMVDRLAPFREYLPGAERGFLALQFPSDACSYLGGLHPCRGFALAPLVNSTAADQSPKERLAELAIDLVYADEIALQQESIRTFVRGLEREGWKPLARERGPRNSWILLRRAAEDEGGGPS